MSAVIEKILSFLKEHSIQFVDLRFTDFCGKEQNVTVKSHVVDKIFSQKGKCLMALLLQAGKAYTSLYLKKVKIYLRVGEPIDHDLFELSPAESAKIPKVCHSLEEALQALDSDRAFLKADNVFSDDLIDGYIQLKQKEIERLMMTTHPVEFEMYYSL